MIQATGGSLYNRALVHPDYKDWGPRLGLAYSFDAKTVVRGGYGISYDVLQPRRAARRRGSTLRRPFSACSASRSRRRPACPPTFLTTLNSFYDQHRQPRQLQSGQFQRRLHSRRTANGRTSRTGSSRCSGNSPRTPWSRLSYNGNHSLRLPIIADYNQAAPNQPGGTLTYQQRAPIPTFGPITWVDPAGNNHYNGLSARVEHRFTKGLYFLNSFTWGNAMGDSEQALEYYAGYFEANPQNIHDLAAEEGPSSFDVKFNNVTSVVYQLPFGKGRRFGSNMNPVWTAYAGRMGTEHHQHRAHRHAARRLLHSLHRERGQLPFERLSRRAVPAPQRHRQRRQPEHCADAEHLFRRLYLHHSAGQRSVRQSGPQCVPRARLRAVGPVGVDKNFRIRETARLQFRSEFFNLPNHTNFGIPNTNYGQRRFGTIRTTYPSRQIQFALKAIF